MRISLGEFLKTGNLGELHRGLTEQEVRQILGIPDAVGGTSLKYRRPSLLRYGSIQFHFSHTSTNGCTSISITPGSNDQYHFPSTCYIEDWELVPGATQDSVEEYLVKKGIKYSHASKLSSNTELRIESSSISIVFDDGQLWSIAAVFRVAL